MRLFLIRHGEAVGNPEHRLLGRTDPPLTTNGMIQAQALGQFFATYSPTPTLIFTSPLQRARQTAQNLATAFPSTPMPIIPDLTEIDLGIFQGLTWAEARQRYPDLCQHLETSLDLLPIPGAETPQAITLRATQAWNQILKTLGNPTCIWIVSHGGFLPYLLQPILQTRGAWGVTIPNLAWFELELHLPDYAADSPLQAENCELRKIIKFNYSNHDTTPSP